MDAKAAVELTQRASFDKFTPITLRYSNQDPMQHINNCAFAAFVEAARVALVQGILDRFDHPGLDFILANVSIDYRLELHFPGTIDVGARLIAMGTKSITSGYGIFRGDDCIATATSTNVFHDMNTRMSVAPPDDVRAALEAEIVGGS